MNKLLIYFVLGILPGLNAQSINTKYIPADLHHTCLLVEQIDSIGPRCRLGNSWSYCSDSDKSLDKQLPTLIKTQETVFRSYNSDYLFIMRKAFAYQEHNDLKDVIRYRYILKIHILDNLSGKKDDVRWLYFFFDRKTGKAYPRITQISDFKFRNLKALISELNESGISTLHK